MGDQVKVLVISGAMGSGKTTVMAEVSDLLIAADIPHAAVDLDALGIVHPSDGGNEDLWFQNLQSVWNNYSRVGIRRLIIATALETIRDRERLRQAVPGAEIVVCRLRASLDTMQQRIRVREPGICQQKFVTRASELDALLDATNVEDFSIDNDRRSVTEVARDALVLSQFDRTL